MTRRWLLMTIATMVFFALPHSASAYVGPGGGITVLGAALALITAIVLGIFGFIWYPLKRLMRAFSKKSASDPRATDT